MKIFGCLVKKSIFASALMVLFFSIVDGQTVQSPANSSSSPRELNMLVLGDSILWGQGLKDEHKAWYLVKSWLEATDGIVVRAKIEAHAGAVIGSAGTPPVIGAAIDGEISRAWPTLHDQIDDALKLFVDPAQVDLVLVDGCINDVNARRLLNAANTPEGIHGLAAAKCGAPVEALLVRVTSSFPNAHVIVTGYYPVVSEKTPRNLFIRALVKKFYETQGIGTPRLSDKQLFARLTAISKEWYQASNYRLMEDAARADRKLTAKGSRQRVLFAAIPFLPDHSFAARDSRLWGFDASALRKLAAVITFGRTNLRANDERQSERSRICHELFERTAAESDEQERVRKDRLLVCRLAAIAHPNRKGAVMYAEAIKSQLGPVITKSGWLRPKPKVMTPATSIP